MEIRLLDVLKYWIAIPTPQTFLAEMLVLKSKSDSSDNSAISSDDDGGGGMFHMDILEAMWVDVAKWKNNYLTHQKLRHVLDDVLQPFTDMALFNLSFQLYPPSVLASCIFLFVAGKGDYQRPIVGKLTSQIVSLMKYDHVRRLTVF
jgi:hypothetical protein